MKSCLEDLAIFGGPAAFAGSLHIGTPNRGDRQRFLQQVDEILERGRFTNNGSQVQELEKRIAGLLGVKHCLAICN